MLGPGGRTGCHAVGPMHRSSLQRRGLAAVLTALALALGGSAGAAEPGRQAALLAEHATLQASLADSPFSVPLLLRGVETGAPLHSGQVLAVLARPLDSVAAVLRTAGGVCGLLLLQLNVRACQPTDGPEGQRLQLTAGPLHMAMPGLTTTLALQLLPQVDAPRHFSTWLTAPAGPLGSSDLQVQLEAVALTPGSTYMHIGYRQTSGLAARLATQVYLSTAGRDKVGFSRDMAMAEGPPRLVGGERGALERQVMRHYLALVVSTGPASGAPAAQADARLRAWFALTERHATQLHEIDLAGYLADKAGVAAGLR
jgi:hypothetical protein